ncbi:Actin-interacting protein 1 [Spathaspora sp. JA1]|nr:Actin-interacting protein 1 [Spathaspora sp. JA1]
MSIKPIAITVPQPSTSRGTASHISYDSVNQRLAYVNGKSIIVRPVDFKSSAPVICFSKHIHNTTAVSFSPSGFYIASGDESGQIKIWDTSISDDTTKFEQPTIKSEFQIMAGPIRSIAWDGENSRIIAVGQGKEKFGHAFSWDSGNSIGDIQGHSSAINAVAIKQQRPYRAATVGDDFALVFFNGPPFKFDKSLRGYHTNVIRDVKFSPDGNWLVSVGSDRNIVVYQGKTGEFVKKIENSHDGGIFAVAWLDSKYFITASADNTLKKWDVESFECGQTFKVSDTVAVENHQVGLALAKEYVISLSANGNLNYFDYSGTLVQVVKGHQASLTTVEYGDGSLYTGGADGKLFKWGVNEQGPSVLPESVTGHSNYVVDVIKVGSSQYSIGWDDTLKIWENGTVSNSVKLPAQPKQLAKTTSGIIVLFESKIQLYTTDLSLLSELDFNFTSNSIGVISDSELLITNSATNTIEELKIDSNTISKSSKEFPKMRSPPTLIRVSPSAEHFAVADSAGKYTLFKVSDGSVVTTRWAFHSSRVYDAKWTSDSKFLISGGLDSGLFVYSVEKPAKVVKYPLAHLSGISGLDWVSYDPEAKSGKVVTTGLDGTIRTWEVNI